MKKLISLLVTALFVLAACGSGSDSSADATNSDTSENEVITIGYQKGNTINILKEHGNLDEALNEAGYTIEWKVFTTGTVLLEALNTNNIDFGHASDGNAVFMQSGGHQLNYLASEAPYPEGVALVTKVDSDIETVEDFKGKKIGVTRGGNQHYLLLVALEEAGISLDEVDIKFYKDAAEGLAAFTKDEFDVYGTWDPYLAIVENTVETRTILNGTDLTENRTFYFGTEELLSKKPEVVKIILEELQNADRWANENKTEVAEILAAELGLDIAPLQQANDRRTFGVEKIDEEIIASQQQLADTFLAAELLETEISIEEAVNIDEALIPSNLE
ncbi:aliphatic sulfonate ABC transporter substrate-binding protein [Oceanobacillus polygoni]|uniref:Aliphatic sulfonates family ABC transporter substrate-binding protein n=1 Tax=Oceanobacillus polygoni TaxID=1235259 RepID=A0A9X1CFT1_9BACI|nr:aliphatic sulfonate ABC transporter substrate-binding protein [Oceanobacillus polygoni]MBP2076902.1 aliphatic sulfonates family ABC transporter substrate-binding protein [Oceanobacillus polygoni]